MLPSQKKKIEKKGKNKNGQISGGFDLFGGGRDDDDVMSVTQKKQSPSARKQSQTQQAVAKRL